MLKGRRAVRIKNSPFADRGVALSDENSRVEVRNVREEAALREHATSSKRKGQFYASN